MNIQKFNESYRGDKVIKIYNNNIILQNYQNDADESKKTIIEINNRLKLKKQNIINIINEYIKYNIDHFHKKYGVYNGVNDFNFYIDEDTKTPKMSLHPTHSWENDNIWLKYYDIEKLLFFLDNPDLYKDEEKYNL